MCFETGMPSDALLSTKETGAVIGRGDRVYMEYGRGTVCDQHRDHQTGLR